MNYLSVCSGIEAATVAWHPLGFTPFGFAEIEAFPSAVLAHHYGSNLPSEPWSGNAPPNFGDMTKFKDWPDATLDVLVGGTPCQSFSVAGLRGGLADPRGNLCLTFLAIADKYRPEWVLWENVPGVLSSDGGRDFGAFLGGLGQLGYGWAYRVLDAQYVRVDGFTRAVPQRRRRVFVVGCAGDWRRAAAVLFERESLQGHPAPRRQAGKNIAPTISSRPTGGGGLGTDFDLDGGLIAERLRGHPRPGSNSVGAITAVAFGGNNCSGPVEVAAALQAHAGPAGRQDFASETFIAAPVAASLTRGAESAGKGGYAGCRQEDDINLVAIQERAICENPDAGPDGAGIRTDGAAYTLEARTVPQAVAFNWQGGGDQTNLGFDPDSGITGSLHVGQTPAVATFDPRNVTSKANRTRVEFGEPSNTLHEKGLSLIERGESWAVRHLTPRECERLQGFPDCYTAVPYRNKPAADGPRYKALGNSMAVNAMRWIGQRIKMVQSQLTK